MSYITAIGIASPKYKCPQQGICEFMVAAMNPDPPDERRLRTVFRGTGIAYRHSVVGDYGRTKDFEFYPNTPTFEPFPTTADRMRLYRDEALPLSLSAIRNCMSNREGFSTASVTHLVVVSCTGLYAPGLDIEISTALSLSDTVERTCVTFMGCYAAFTGLKLAHNFCESNPAACVLVVCTELCSLHFQREVTDDNLLANALFADGSAAMIVEAEPGPRSLRTVAFRQQILSNGAKDMAWTIGNHGFQMKLTSDVPSIIRCAIKRTWELLLNDAGLSPGTPMHYAVHPGGKKILEAVEQELGVTKEQNSHAYNVLRNYGNMSSPTVLFVLKSLLDTLQADAAHILSFAFGPGLTLESAVFQFIK